MLFILVAAAPNRSSLRYAPYVWTIGQLIDSSQLHYFQDFVPVQIYLDKGTRFRFEVVL